MDDGRAAVLRAWPLFGLVIRSERLELRLPREDELGELLRVAQAGVHDPEFMPFGFAWTDKKSPDYEREFMQYHWRTRSGWSVKEWILDLGVWMDGRIVGTQGLRGDNYAVMREIGTGSWLGREHQGKGIGKEMRSAVLAFAFDQLGAERAHSGAFLDNDASVGVSRALGYSENGTERMAPRGVAREHQRFLMTRDSWYSLERPPITVDGFDACRDMFGI
jgi:RimJ/RimL family protein N-acetyltransferase